jgi:hypothetical protein
MKTFQLKGLLLAGATIVALSMSGCSSKAGTGAAIGAGGGALVGSAVGGTRGAVAGAAIGGITGAAIGDSQDRKSGTGRYK